MEVIEVTSHVKEEYLSSIERCAAQTKKELMCDYARWLQWWENNKHWGPKPKMLDRFSKSSAMYYLRLAIDFVAILELHSKHLEWTFYVDEVYKID